MGVAQACHPIVISSYYFLYSFRFVSARQVDVGICTIRMNSHQNASFQIPYARASSGSSLYNFRFRCPCEECISGSFRIAKRTKSKTRMQITEFLARLSQHKRVLREIQGIWAKFSFRKCFRNTGFCPLRNLQNHPPFQFVCLSLV